MNGHLLTIYFTSDTHGYLYPTTFASKQPQPMGLLSMRFPKDENTLIIDGGDTLQGSPLTYFGHSQGVSIPVARAMTLPKASTAEPVRAKTGMAS